MVFNFAVQLFLPSHYEPSAGLFDPRGKETPKYVSKFAKSEQLLSEHLAPVAEPKRNVQSFRSNSSPVSGSLVAEQIVPLTLINKEVRFFIKTASKNFCDKVFVTSPPLSLSLGTLSRYAFERVTRRPLYKSGRGACYAVANFFFYYFLRKDSRKTQLRASSVECH